MDFDFSLEVGQTKDIDFHSVSRHATLVNIMRKMLQVKMQLTQEISMQKIRGQNNDIAIQMLAH